MKTIDIREKNFMAVHTLPDAPDFARGFIGIVYRANEDDSEFKVTCTD